MNKLEETIKRIEAINTNAIEEAQKKLDNLTKPQGSLGRLEEIAKKVAGITGKINHSLGNKTILVIAADHGVIKEGISAFPQEVTQQMVYNFLNGGAGINVLAKHVGAKVIVVDAGVAADLTNQPGLIINKIGYGTKNIADGPAMTKEEAIRSIETGITIAEDQIASGAGIIGTGEMGIGNTTASSAIVSVITNNEVEKVTGRGTGIDDKAFANKIAVIKQAIKKNNPNADDGIDVLSKLGGFEIGMIAGIFLGCAANRIPSVIDGFISGAAALIACTIEPKTKNFIFASHCSVESGHKITLDFLKLKSMFNFDFRLGEGTGAAFGISIIDASLKILNEMATFNSAGVSEKI